MSRASRITLELDNLQQWRIIDAYLRMPEPDGLSRWLIEVGGEQLYLTSSEVEAFTSGARAALAARK
jgi:hypothetical protein